MKIVIAGSGRLGSKLAATLARQGHHMAVIDIEPQAFERLPKDLVESGQVVVVTGDAASADAMEEAGIRQAVLFIAATDQDALNGLASLKAKLVYRVKQVVCTVRDEDLHRLYEAAGITSVNPASLAAERVLGSFLVEDVEIAPARAQGG